MLDAEYTFTVTDLKQFDYCQRVIFYERCLPHVRPRTAMMEIGQEQHEDEDERAVRRTLSSYDIENGRREFHLRLSSPTLGIHGLLDEVIYADDGHVIPIDYKFANAVNHNHRIQLTAYALLLEENGAAPIAAAYIYLIPKHQTVKVPITPKLRAEVVQLLADLRQMIAAESMPPPNKIRQRCTSCEFRRFCNDV